MLAIVVSVLASGMNSPTDGSSIVEAMGEGSVTGDQAKVLGGDAYVGIATVANSMGASIEPISILFVESILSLLSKIFPEQLEEYARQLGMINSVYLCIIIILLFVALKIIRSNAFTKVAGLAAEDIENKIGMVVTVAMPFIYYFDSCTDVAYAADGMQAFEIVRSGLSIVSIAVLSVAMLITYYVIRTVVYAVEIMLIPISVTPFVSAVTEGVKTIGVIVTLICGAVAPGVTVVLFVLVFVGCLFLFKKAYVTIRYFKSIYIAPIFRKKSNEPVDQKNVSKYLGAGEQVQMFIPVFCHCKTVNGFDKYDKCWLCVKDNEMAILKSQLFKKNIIRYNISQNETCYLSMNKRFIEIFTLENGEENKINYGSWGVKKPIQFMISREYSGLFNLIGQTLQCTNYEMLQQELKRRKEEQKVEEKRLRQANRKSLFMNNRKR